MSKTSKNVIQILKERGFIENATSDQLETFLSESRKIYIGFDPTAESLHIGNLVGLIVAKWFKKCGHQVYALAGGATGLIGDPTGKSAERPLLDAEQIKANLSGIESEISSFLSEGEGLDPVFVNNLDWFKGMDVLSFLREVAGYFRMGPLLSRETVKERLSSGEGMSLKEFCYPVIQGYDFMKLFEENKVELQIGGSDQWTNITAGIELVRKKHQKEVFGLTFPLLLKSDGKKFGKSESGAIWLSKDKLSVYDFYQHFVRVADADVITMLKRLTFLDIEKINALEKSMHEPGYKPNTVQKVLAKEVTQMVHGHDAVETALAVTEAIQPGSQASLDLKTLQQLAEKIPSFRFSKAEIFNHKLVDVLALTKQIQSKGEARRLIKSGGVYLNNERVSDEQMILQESDFIDKSCALVSMGKKKKMLLFVQ